MFFKKRDPIHPTIKKLGDLVSIENFSFNASEGSGSTLPCLEALPCLAEGYFLVEGFKIIVLLNVSEDGYFYRLRYYSDEDLIKLYRKINIDKIPITYEDKIPITLNPKELAFLREKIAKVLKQENERLYHSRRELQLAMPNTKLN